jgi:hypothetical protein
MRFAVMARSRKDRQQDSPPTSVGRKPITLVSATNRSRLTNGADILPRVNRLRVDHRTPWMRRLRDLIAEHVADLGGDDMITHAERALVNRVAMLIVQLERKEARFAAQDGEASDEQLRSYLRGLNSLNRVLGSLGLKRRPRDITPTPPSVDQYLSQEAAE